MEHSGIGQKMKTSDEKRRRPTEPAFRYFSGEY
jgi:hypothetical protein